MDTKNEKYICVHCSKTFSRKDNMQRHVRSIHREMPQMGNHNFKCPAIKCNKEALHSYKSLREHIVTEHDVTLEVEKHHFATFIGKNSFVIFIEFCLTFDM